MKQQVRLVLVALLFLAGLKANFSFGQSGNGDIHGSFQVDVQTYEVNEKIGISEDDINGEKLNMNGFGNFIYTLGDFTAGMRFESYLKPLNGYDKRLEGTGVPYKFLSYKKDMFDITVGNFYEQFGNGMILRTYEDWNLGVDNSLDGLRVKITPVKGIEFKGVYGVQRFFWEKYENGNRGIVRGLDGEFNLNDLMRCMSESKTKIILGGGIVSKYQKDNPVFEYKLPENVAAWSGRFTLSRGNVTLKSEYARKINDPSAMNNYIYRDGQALFVSAVYSKKGFGIELSAKRIDNMSFKSNRNHTGNGLDINFLPPLTKQHFYSFESMYPYATQPNGEIGFQGKIDYNFAKKTPLGGQYGTSISLDYSRINSIDRQAVNDTTAIMEKGTEGYTSDFFKFGDELFFEDINFEITKKLSKKWKFVFAYTHLAYNYDVIEEGLLEGKKYYAHIGAFDLTHKFTDKHALRLELQYLQTEQDSGKWLGSMLEYTIAPKWFFAAREEYNFDNPVSDNTYFYYSFAAGYTHKTHRIMMSYGTTREGILCVGGVCRRVPAANGFTLTITSSF